MSYKEIIDNVSNIEDLDNVTILKVLEEFSKTIKDFAIEQSGLNNLVNVEFIPSDNNTTYTGDSVDYLGTLKLTLSDNIIVNKSCNIKFNIKGSNTIVVNVDEFNNSLELHLDNSVVTTLAFAESERQKSQTDGAIVHDKQLKTREILYKDSTSINIDDSTLTTLAEYVSLFDLDKTKTYKSVIGSASNSNFKSLVGNLSNNSSYTICYIKYIGESEGGASIYELLAYEPLAVVTVAKGYIYSGNRELGTVWTGWTEFK